MGNYAGMCYIFNVASCTEICEMHPDVGVCSNGMDVLVWLV